MMVGVGFLLTGCSPSAGTPETTPDIAAPTSSTTSSPQPSATRVPSTETPPPSHTLTPVDASYQIVQNSSLSHGLSHWGQRMGRLSHVASEYYTAPGAGLIVTSEMDNSGVAAQCISLQERLPDWPTTDGQKRVTFDAFLKTDPNIDRATLLIIFHEGDCGRPDQFHTQVGTMQSSPVSGEQDWTHVSISGIIPGDASSVDVIIWASGRTESAQAYFDDVRSYVPSP